MGVVKIESFSTTFSPAAVGSTEVKEIVVVKKGDVITGGAIRKLVLGAAASPARWSMRASSAAGGVAQGILANTATDTGSVGDVVNGTAADIATAGGFMCTGDGTVNIVYTANAASGAPPAVRARVFVIRRDENL